jgi:Family of unknown function (DUF6338)
LLPGESVGVYLLSTRNHFLPGIIWERVITKYALKRQPTPFEIGLRTFTFGLTAYLITFGILTIFGVDILIPEMKKDTPFIVDARYLTEFLAAIAVSLVCSIIWLYVTNYRLAGRFLRFLGATRRYGREDVWDFSFSAAGAWSEYVYVRDYKNAKVFSGWVSAFSENEKLRELLLRDVEVFDLEGRPLYASSLIYLGRSPDSIHSMPPHASRPPARGSTIREYIGAVHIDKGGTNSSTSQVVVRRPPPPPSNPPPAKAPKPTSSRSK